MHTFTISYDLVTQESAERGEAHESGWYDSGWMSPPDEEPTPYALDNGADADADDIDDVREIHGVTLDDSTIAAALDLADIIRDLPHDSRYVCGPTITMHPGCYSREEGRDGAMGSLSLAVHVAGPDAEDVAALADIIARR
jgi:hypothetical protein